MSQLKGLVELVQIAIDQGATTVEEIHKSIANEPLEVLQRLGLFEEQVRGIQQIQNMTIGSVYNIIRTINNEVSTVTRELLSKAECASTD